MECPMCNRPVKQDETPDGELRLWCPACGWGAGDAPAEEADDHTDQTAVWKLLLLWAAGLTVVIGPYFALRYGLPSLFDIGLRGADEAYAKYLAALNGWYGIGMATYLAAAGLFTPTYDPDNVGFFGGMIDNPFSFQDDYERTKRTLLFVLLPGKVFWAAVKLTWYRIAG
jgi:hypothetical protein